MIPDEELKKTFEIFVDKGDFILATILKEVKGVLDNTRQIELIEKEILEIFEKDFSKEYKVILDLLPLGKGRVYTSSGDRKIWARLARQEQIKKCAIVGSSMILRVVANFVIKISGRDKDMKWFFEKEEALGWLKEE